MLRAAEFARRFPYAMKCDIRRYFPSIDHEILLARIGRVVADPSVLGLVRTILESHRDGERIVYGETLFDAKCVARGLPIGNLTSQFFANIYLDGFDHFVKQELRAKGYVRYVDDFLIFGEGRQAVRAWGEDARRYLGRQRLEIHPDKYRLCRTAEGVDFCGFVVRSDGRVRVRRASVRRFQKKYRHRRWQWRRGECKASDVRATVQAWIAHVAYAQSWRLRSRVFGG